MSNEYFTIDSILGQEKAKDMLRRAVLGKRLSHAYLFRGPEGVGKKSLARAFGNYINCRHRTDDQDACGSCDSCRKLRSGSHPDQVTIEPDGVSIKIKQIRELKHALTFPPFEADCRTIIITDVHTMRREAANSLLKTLEEPPPGNLLILTGDEAGDILPTIISRCQVVPFTGLPHDLVANKLTEEGTDPHAAATLAAVADGSLGRARLLADTELLELRKDIINGLLELEAGGPQTAEEVFRLAEQAAAESDYLPELIELLKLWSRDLVMLSHNLRDQINNRDLQDLNARAAARWSPVTLLNHLDLFDKARQELARNCNRTLVCESLFFGLL
ncbi:MAG: DNA polymerase III subunit delta' [Thermodesulfobacteriota bacterium]